MSRVTLTLPPPVRRWTIIVGAVIGSLAFFGYVFLVPHAGSFSDQPPRPLATSSPVQPDALGQARKWFGPWQSAASSGHEIHSLVMLKSGSGLDQSSWMVSVTSDWQPTQLPDLTVTRSSRRVQLQTAAGQRVYTLKLGQPFMVDTRPNAVYAVVAGPDRDDRTSTTIVSVTPEWAYAHGHRR